MRCSRCHFENRETAKFCPECGQQLGNLPDDTRFASPQSYTPKHLAEKILTTSSSKPTVETA